MYWWNYRKLAVALREGTVTAQQQRTYTVLFALMVFGCVGLALSALVFFPSPPTPANIAFNYVLPAFSIVVMLLVPFATNRAGDGKDFWKRFICLNLPVNVRYLAIFLPIITAVIIVEQGIFMYESCASRIDAESGDMQAFDVCVEELPTAINSTWLDVTIYAVSILVYSYWFHRAFLIASGKNV